MNNQTDIQTLVDSSGNSFHCKVVSFFKEKGWSVLISPYYNDNISDKPREVDLVAEKAFSITGNFGDSRGDLDVKLFIECKYVPQKTVFWFHDKDTVRARELVLGSTPMQENNAYTDKHHYLNTNPLVAKLFASESKKNSENEIIYKALNQSLNAMVYFRRSKSIIPDAQRRMRESRHTINYPVILCDSFSKFYRVNVGSDLSPALLDENFQLEVNYAYVDSSKHHKHEYFLIDVVEYRRMDDFLKSLKNDVDAMQVFLH